MRPSPQGARRPETSCCCSKEAWRRPSQPSLPYIPGRTMGVGVGPPPQFSPSARHPEFPTEASGASIDTLPSCRAWLASPRAEVMDGAFIRMGVEPPGPGAGGQGVPAALPGVRPLTCLQWAGLPLSAERTGTRARAHPGAPCSPHSSRLELHWLGATRHSEGRLSSCCEELWFVPGCHSPAAWHHFRQKAQSRETKIGTGG